MNEQEKRAAGTGPARKEGWERELLERLAFASLREQRAARRWRIFFRLLTLILIGWGFWIALGVTSPETAPLAPHTALIEIDGEIEAGTEGSAEAVIPALQQAFEEDSAVGVVLRINSPGGSPVQAGMINDEITRLRAAYPRKPLFVVVDEICASGGYYIAAAADKIFVNKASIVGSIGVMMQSFGVTNALDKLGVERRLLTAGENKAFLDPFSPLSEEHRAHAQQILNEIHQQFIEVVERGRGDRLRNNGEIFSGLFWSGERAVELGLADSFGTIESVAREELKAEEVVDYTRRKPLTKQLLERFGGAVGAAIVSAFEQSAGRPALK